jgi:hypothetical protein
MTGAIQEALNGKPVDWMEKVSDEQYQKVTSDEKTRQDLPDFYETQELLV